MVLVSLIASIAAIGGVDPISPTAWSPDGAWLVHVEPATIMEQRKRENATSSLGWLSSSDTPDIRSAYEGVTGYKLWATRAGDSAATCLAESNGPLTAPCWSHSGRLLAYGQWTIAEQETRYEIVLQSALDRRRVLKAWTGVSLPPRPHHLELVPAFTADDRKLAAPGPDGRSLVEIDVLEGKLIREHSEAIQPSWSSVTDRLAFYRPGAQSTIVVVDPGHRVELRELEVPGIDTHSPPIWAGDGESLVVLTATKDPETSGMRIQPVRIGLDEVGAGPVPLVMLTDRGSDELAAGALALDTENDVMFIGSALMSTLSTQVTLSSSRNVSVQKRFPILDATLGVAAIEWSPTSRKIAVRLLAPGGIVSPPLVCNPVTEQFTLLTPDAQNWKRWATLVVERAASLVKGGEVASTAPPGGGRSTWLPLTGDRESNHPLQLRIDRLGRAAGELLARALPDSIGIDSRVLSLDSEPDLRLAMQALGGDVSGALETLEGWERGAVDKKTRSELLVLRGHLLILANDWDRADAIVESLRPPVEARAVRWEEAGGRVRLEPVLDFVLIWLDDLFLRLKELRAGQEGETAAGIPIGAGVLRSALGDKDTRSRPRILPEPPQPGAEPEPRTK